MNCPTCGGEVRVAGRTTNYYVPVRGHYWSDAERAGLKEIGNRLKDDEEYLTEYDDLIYSDAIIAYVYAARKVKEGK